MVGVCFRVYKKSRLWQCGQHYVKKITPSWCTNNPYLMGHLRFALKQQKSELYDLTLKFFKVYKFIKTPDPHLIFTL